MTLKTAHFVVSAIVKVAYNHLHFYFFKNGKLITMFNVSFSDGVHITIFGVEDVQVNSLSATDVEFNNVASKAESSETEYLRLCNIINNRLRVEVL